MQGPPDTEHVNEALAAFGLQPDQPPLPTKKCAIWPENVLPLQIIRHLQTQWHVGMNGRTGLRYEALPLALRTLQVPRYQWQQVIEAVQVLELELLRLWREKM